MKTTRNVLLTAAGVVLLGLAACEDRSPTPAPTNNNTNTTQPTNPPPTTPPADQPTTPPASGG